MIRIHVILEDNDIKQITLKGHANYKDYGNDIVCAAASATFLCTVNAILSNAIEVRSDKDCQMIQVLRKDEIVTKLLYNMMNCLKSLEKQYPNNIKIK
jgi:hypothetical protein